MARVQGAHEEPFAQEPLRAALLAWYRREARDLPWRRTRDPYAIWVSEIMLQQTRVETVIPHYERFLEAFPTVHALADAPLERVLERWSGLGYYRRARLLHAGAAEVRRRGELPKTARELRAIPGIGAYTAGAIASIAHQEEEPAVDGNVVRVLARLFTLRENDPKRIEPRARALARGEDPGALNQALMELGARVCTPKPRCDACPVAPHCAARAEGDPSAYPPPRRRASVKRWDRVAIVARHDGALLLARRRLDLVFGGLWEPPCADGRGARAAAKLAESMVEGTLKVARRVRHALTHRDVRVVVFEVGGARPARTIELPPDYDEIIWAREDRPMSTLAKKILGLR